MADKTNVVLRMINDLLGFDIDPGWATLAGLVGVAFSLVFAMHKAWLWIRRLLGDRNAIPDELKLTADIVTKYTENKLNVIFSNFEALHNRLNASLSDRLDSIHTILVSKESTSDSVTDSEIDNDRQTAGSSVRLKLAETVRNTVFQKWLSGDGLIRSSADPGRFDFRGVSNAGTSIRIIFQTPYRSKSTTDGRLPYTLEIWADNYKQLNFEWNLEGKYALRGFKKGEWIEDVANWDFNKLPILQEAKIA